MLRNIKAHKIKVIAILASLSISILMGFLGKEIPFSKQWPLYESLRNTSAIIFGVIGAWMAIVYPEKIKSPFKISDSEDGFESSRLLTPIANSTFILAIVLIIGIIAPIAQQILPISHIKWQRGFSYALLSALTIWQIWTVISTLYPADAIKDKIERDEEKYLSTNELFKLTKNNKNL